MMRTCILRSFVVAGVVLAWALPSAAGGKAYHAWKHTHDNADEVIYELTMPWPFRTVTERAGAASINPTQTREQMETQLLNTGILRVTSVHFATDRARFTPDSRNVLDQIGRILTDWPTLEVEIAGHADYRGSAESNRKLSERRAGAVRKYLVTRFPKIRGRLLTPVGYGESRPIASNSTAEGMAKNRRVEFEVLNEDELARITHMRSYRAGRH